MTTFALSRRLLIQKLAFTAALSLVSRKFASASPSTDRVKLGDYPFKLGVASGSPSSDGMVLWTRLVSDPFDAESLEAPSIPVTWQIAEDEKFEKIIQQGFNVARKENAHAIHAEIYGLMPDRAYFYRFLAGGEISPIGRTRTLPISGTPTTQFRFALASCQDISGGYFAAYRDAINQAPDLIVHVGDYIYEGVYRDEDRRIPVSEAIDLDEYRALYARYKVDPDLQAAHASAPWIVIWDDHEVEDDWGNLFHLSGLTEEQFIKRKFAALKACFEHQPFRLSAVLKRGESRIFSRSVIGDLLELNMLDFRQYRSSQPCSRSAVGMINTCTSQSEKDASLLGAVQERWLQRSFGYSRAKWSALVQTTYMAPFNYQPGDGQLLKADGWDAYSGARQRLLDMIAAKKLENVVSVGGEIHAFYAGVVNAIATDPQSKPLLCEMLTTSISSDGGADERYKKTMQLFKKNAFARYFENRHRGYMLCEVNKKQWISNLRVIDNVRDPKSAARSLGKLVIEDGVVDITPS